ncbi:MAG: hypothetical protein AB1779_02020 [Candidatus Thermoplasmatota archaeon]
MRKLDKHRIIIFPIIILLFFSYSFAQVHVCRAIDIEPNNNQPSGASLLVNNEIVNGSILVISGDLIDWYKIAVPDKNVVNASVYLSDYDYSMPSKYNINLYLGIETAQGIELVDSSETENRWESVSGVSIGNNNFFIAIVANNSLGVPTTFPVNYTLNVFFSVPITLSIGIETVGELDLSSSRSSDWYILSGTNPDELLSFVLYSPITGDFDIYIFNLWSPSQCSYSSLYLFNASWQWSIGDWEEVLISGAEGDFFIKIDCKFGYGKYTLYPIYAGNSIDKDNTRANAKFINSNEPTVSEITQGIDNFDWYKIDMKINEFFGVKFSIPEAKSLYSLIVFDSYGKAIGIKYNSVDGTYTNDPSKLTRYTSYQQIKAEYSGSYYIVVTAVYPVGTVFQDKFIPASTKYNLYFTLPNTPPNLRGNIPDVHFEEEGRFELLLSNYFYDDDGDNLSYSAYDFYNIYTYIEQEKIFFEGTKDWCGNEKIRIRAIDDGPGNKWVDVVVNVFVSCVNDPPMVIGSIENLTVYEGEIVRTKKMSEVFIDVDNDPLNYSIEISHSELRPENASFPRPTFDELNKSFVIGPIGNMFGNVSLEITAEDPNNTKAKKSFFVNILHRNHSPVVKMMPVIALREDEKNDTLKLDELFYDEDLSYADDRLNYSIAGQITIGVYIEKERLIFDATNFEYLPEVEYNETIKVIATDKSNKSACVNITVNIEPIDDLPQVISYLPMATDIKINEGEKIEFKVTVIDNDTDYANLKFFWYFDDLIQLSEQSSFSFSANYSSGDGIGHKVEVKIQDGANIVALSWNLSIADVNRAPRNVKIISPVNYSKFNFGEELIFNATAFDDDGDELIYIWKEAGKEIGKGKSFSTKKLSPGQRTIILEVSDGKEKVSTDVTIVIEKKEEKFIPGFEFLSFLICFILIFRLLLNFPNKPPIS